MQPMITQSQNQLTVGEIKKILRLFRTLRKALGGRLIRKNKDLEKRAHKEAKEEFIIELKKREGGLTFRPGRSRVGPGKTSESKRKRLQEQYDRILEVRTEKKYRSVDTKYDLKMRVREEKIQALIQRIDHAITPLSVEFRKCAEANKTLLIADWPELRKLISWPDFTTQEMQEQISRTIIALKVLRRRFNRKRIKALSLINAGKWIYTETVKAFFDSFFKWCSKGQDNK